MSFLDVRDDGRQGRGEGFEAEEEGPSNPLEKTEALAFQLTTRVASYKRMVDLLGTKKDTQTHRENLRRVAEDISDLAKRTAHCLKQVKPKSKKKKTQHSKLLKDFQTVLSEFQKSQRLCAEKKHLSLPVKTPVKKRHGGRKSHAVDRPSSAIHYPQSEYEAGLREEERLLLERERAQVQEQIGIEGEMEHNNAILGEREEDIKHIQFQIGEVTEIFQDLAVLVSEQGEVVDDIEANIVTSYGASEQAVTELKKAARHQKNARMSLCVIFGIIMVGVADIALLLNNNTM